MRPSGFIAASRAHKSAYIWSWRSCSGLAPPVLKSHISHASSERLIKSAMPCQPRCGGLRGTSACEPLESGCRSCRTDGGRHPEGGLATLASCILHRSYCNLARRLGTFAHKSRLTSSRVGVARGLRSYPLKESAMQFMTIVVKPPRRLKMATARSSRSDPHPSPTSSHVIVSNAAWMTVP
jgi:hypothetical protein